jgi:membrane associated rhomboid family serine protease
MALGSRVCPYCGALNGADESRCHRCERRLPGPLARSVVGLWQTALGRDFPITKLFILLCLAVFVFLMLADRGALAGGLSALLMGRGRLSELVRWGALVPLAVVPGAGDPFATVGRIEPWRFLSAMFVHFGVLHIVFNMMALLDMGRATEQRLGSARFTLIFVVTGVAGFVASDLWFAFTRTLSPTAGASGGLFGLAGALIGYLYAKGDPAWKDFLLRIVIFAVVFAIVLPVNNAAHIAGFLTGVPLGFVFYKESRPWRRTQLFGALAAMLVLLSFASVALSHRSPIWKDLRRMELEQADS